MEINTDDPNDEPTQEEVEAHQLLEIMNEYSQQFYTLAQERHLTGAARYGELTFLENDVVRMMAEELADTANYCRMQFIKLMFINNMLVEKIQEAGLSDDAEEIGIGVKAFKGTKDTGWGKKS
jgi:hypothetical protein